MKKLFFTVLFMCAFGLNVCAVSLGDSEAVEIPESAYENITEFTDGFSFYDAAQSILQGSYTADFKGVVKKTADMFFSEVRKNVKLMAAVVMLGIICTFITNLEGSRGKNGVTEAAFLSCYATLAGITAAGFSEVSDMARGAIDDMGIFIKSLVPALTSMAVAEGKVISAPIMHTQVLLGSVISSGIIKNAVLPLVYASFCVKFINNMTLSESLNNLSAFLDRICKRLLSFVLLIFTALLALTNFAAGTADNMSLKTARFALSSFVPVAGGALADTVTSLAASASMIKNSLGAAGIIAIALMSAYPIIKCAAISFLYNLAGALIQPVTDRRLANAISAVGECMGMLFAIVSVSLALYIICAAIMLSAVGV